MQKQFTKWSMVLVLIIGSRLNAQIGVNNSSPRATLDIQTSTENLTTNTNEGLIPPQINKERLAQIADNNLVEGTIIYINDITYTETPTNPKVTKVIEQGYYVYDGNEWKKLEGKTYTGQDGIEVENAIIKLDEATRSNLAKIDNILKNQMVPLDKIHNRTDRNTITGVYGKWTKMRDNWWEYTGMCMPSNIEYVTNTNGPWPLRTSVLAAPLYVVEVGYYHPKIKLSGYLVAGGNNPNYVPDRINYTTDDPKKALDFIKAEWRSLSLSKEYNDNGISPGEYGVDCMIQNLWLYDE